MFVYLSKFLMQLVYPTGIVFLILVISLLTRREKLRKGLLIAAAGVLFVCGNRFTGALLLRSLESAYPPYNGEESAGAVVVLGGCTESKGYPRQTVEVNGAGDRILYGADLVLQGKADTLLVGGSYIDWQDGVTIVDDKVSSPASEMAEIAVRLGVPEEQILIQDRSLNTAEEAEHDAEMLREKGIDRVILVTSASHMRRAAALFKKQGLEVVPAPTDFSYSDAQWEDITRITWKNAYLYLIPGTSAIRTFETAVKEYIGIFVYRLRGWI